MVNRSSITQMQLDEAAQWYQVRRVNSPQHNHLLLVTCLWVQENFQFPKQKGSLTGEIIAGSLLA